MEVPTQFRRYACTDYFGSERFTRGIWSESEQLWLILAADEVAERSGYDLLVIGRPGVDGIEFGYRHGHEGIWAYYPQEGRFEHLASDVGALVEGWFAGTITV